MSGIWSLLLHPVCLHQVFSTVKPVDPLTHCYICHCLKYPKPHHHQWHPNILPHNFLILPYSLAKSYQSLALVLDFPSPSGHLSLPQTMVTYPAPPSTCVPSFVGPLVPSNRHSSHHLCCHHSQHLQWLQIFTSYLPWCHTFHL